MKGGFVKMKFSKLKWKFILAVCLVLLTCGIVCVVNAQVRPTNPTMDYVPQNVGIYDTYYDFFKEPDCRACHGTTTEDRHHSTNWAHDDYCLYCPRQWPDVVPAVRECKVCHKDNSSEMRVCSEAT